MLLLLQWSFREALINKNPKKKNVGLIQGSQIATLITWIWPKNRRFAFGATLLLWKIVGFWSVWGNFALNAKIAEIVFSQWE